MESASLRSPDRLTLVIDPCNKNPEVSLLRETDVDVQVKVVCRLPTLFHSGAHNAWRSYQLRFKLQRTAGRSDRY